MKFSFQLHSNQFHNVVSEVYQTYMRKGNKGYFPSFFPQAIHLQYIMYISQTPKKKGDRPVPFPDGTYSYTSKYTSTTFYKPSKHHRRIEARWLGNQLGSLKR